MYRTLFASVAVLLLAAPGAHAKRCSRLQDYDIAAAKHVVLAEVPNAYSGYDLVGCILPRGAVHTIASSSEQDLESSGYDVLKVAREKVMVTSGSGDQYGGENNTFVADIRTNAFYTVLSQCTEIATGFCPGPQQDVAASRLNQIGQSAVILTTSSSATVVGFSTHGARTELDNGTLGEIDRKSLRLRGSTVSWTHAGERRSFTLTG